MRIVKRFAALVMSLALLAGMLAVPASAAAFSDEDQITYKEEVAITAGLGLFAGADGKFMPQDTVTRAQMATIIVKMLHGADANADGFKGVSGGFTDTANFEGGWAEGYINWCASLGIVKGYGDGTFKPGNKVTAAEAVTMILNALKIDAGEGTWPVTVMAKAEEVKFFSDLKTKPASDKALSREELAVVSLAGLEYSPEGKTGYMYDGKVYDNYMDALLIAGDASKITPAANDTLATKVYELKTMEGFITGNQETGLVYTELNGTTPFAIESGLDSIGHYVTVYYKEAYTSEDEPGVTYAIHDDTVVVEVEEAIDSANAYKKAFAKNYNKNTEITMIDGEYNVLPGTGSIAGYVGGSAAPEGTYFIYKNNIVAYMAPTAVYATTVADIGDYEGEESILLADGRNLANTEGNDEVVEYPGVNIGDYVTYTVAQDMCVLNPVSVVRGTVRSVSRDENGVAQFRIESMTFPMFEGVNTTDLETSSDLDFNLTYEFYITHDDKLLGYKQSDAAAGTADVVYLLGAYTTKAKDSYGKEIIYTNAQGANTSGEEVILVLGVKKPGEDQLGLAADQISQVPEGFYTVTEHTGKEERKAGIQVVDRCEAGYDKEENPYFIGTIKSGSWSSTAVYLSTHHICDSTCGAIDGTTHTGGTSAVAFYNAATKWITVDGTLGQPLEVVMTPRAQMSQYAVAGTDAYKFPMLFSKTDSGATQVELIVLKANKNTLMSGGSPLFVAPSSLKPVATTGDGYLYELYDGHTGAAKQVVMDEAELSVGSSFYTWVEEDGIVTLLDTQKSDTTDKIFYSSGLIFDSLYDGSRIISVNPSGGENYLSADSVSSAKVVDTRTDEEKAASKVDTITSIARLEVLRKSGKVPVIAAYSTSNTCKVLFVTDILVGPSVSEVIYLPTAPVANSVNTVIDANGVTKQVFINEASTASGFVTYVNDNGVLKVEANANGVGGSYSDQKLVSVSGSKLSTTDLTDIDAANAAIIDQTGEGIETLADLAEVSQQYSDITLAVQTSGTKATLIIVGNLAGGINANCAAHADGSVMANTTAVLTDGTWYLRGDTEATGNITVTGDVTLCLADYTLTAPASGGTFITVSAGAKLTICGGDHGTGTITGRDGVTAQGIAVRGEKSNAATLTLDSGKITNFAHSATGAGVYVYGTSTFNMNGGSITGNTSATNGGGVFVSGASSLGYGTFNMNGGTISGNVASGNGGGVMFNAATAVAKLNGGSVTGNTAGNMGGGLYLRQTVGSLGEIKNMTITGNTAAKGDDICYGFTVSTSGTAMAIGEGSVIGKVYLTNEGNTSYYVPYVTVENASVESVSVLAGKEKAGLLTITSGTFGFDPSDASVSSWVKLAANTEVVKSGDKWVVQELVLPTYTATVGAVSNGTVNVDPASATAGSKVTVTATPDAGYELEAIKVDGNVVSATSPYQLTLNGDCVVTADFVAAMAPGSCGHESGTVLTDSTTVLADGVYRQSGNVNAGANITVTGDATLCLCDFTLTAPAAGGDFITVEAGAKLTLCGGTAGTGTILANTGASDARGVTVNGTMVMESGTISGFKTSGHGGAIYMPVAASNVTIKNGTFSGNTGNNGGAIYALASGASLTIEDGTFVDNVATNLGGALRTAANVNCSITGGTYTNNVSQGSGNRTFQFGSTTVIRGVTVTVPSGGVICNSSGKIASGIFNINPGTYVDSGSTATESGGVWIVTPN